MREYLMVLLAVVLLALGFVLRKVYQNHTDGTTESGVNFGIMSAVCSIVILVLTSGFTISFTWFSVAMALWGALCCLAYTVIGFRIMKEGGMALFTLFLMSGGMLVPAVWGWLFLHEKPVPLHLLGVLVVLAAVILGNLGSDRPSAKVLLLCVAVFVLNGFVSVSSKLHQANEIYEKVPTANYALLSAAASLVSSLLLRLLLFLKNGSRKKCSAKHILLPVGIVAGYSLLGTFSSVLQLEGAKSLPASVLYPMITGGSVALTGIFALLFFGEKLSKRGWLSVALCCLGTCLFI